MWSCNPLGRLSQVQHCLRPLVRLGRRRAIGVNRAVRHSPCRSGYAGSRRSSDHLDSLARLLGVSSTRFGNGTVSTAVITVCCSLSPRFAIALRRPSLPPQQAIAPRLFRGPARETPCIEQGKPFPQKQSARSAYARRAAARSPSLRVPPFRRRRVRIHRAGCLSDGRATHQK
jgi:hypothetical protein